ncbi:kinase-like domain-containing protein [Pseudomassariella vexata]|uniref:Kinase-like domain-containing protein n=1 Tax=Pseudomassariella vexata TaxID=1141098 RepID=A0A1Y2E7R0_9PEZI|nr:kinase-like domain-containing protein [Pseudomassariella vexata]ORY67613.1 kinase-like domain-containing protein [Pseudomassariella vexata]
MGQTSLEALSGQVSNPSPRQGPEDSGSSQPHHHRLDHMGERLISQVAEWLEHERTKKQQRKTRRVYSHKRKSPPAEPERERGRPEEPGEPSAVEQLTRHHRRYSIDSQSSDVSLDRLQRIIDDSMNALGLNSIPHYRPGMGRKSHKKRAHHLHRTASSDTEYHDGDVRVPSCDAVLDNSKTMSYSGGKSGEGADGTSVSSRKVDKEREDWIKFKNDVLRIAHTLRIKGWRRVPLDTGDTIDIERLSGALTNAVYVVTPPQELLNNTEGGKKAPAKLLLRVYGPQVENIIDRDNELNVLKRLSRKKIGPRMLGTFENGRFEQFFNAITLTPAHLREPETSKQIAKRMRELHDGIELLEEEKDGGPAVFKNWDHWLDNTAKVVTYLDRKGRSGGLGPIRGPADAWKERGLICGVEWAKFEQALDKYRKYLDDYYAGHKNLRDQLVFAHNDTQYGNILRIRPDDEKSPLMSPQNEHKQLIVIDFEYAAANMRGHEFANHFTEWTYNYHNVTAPYACNTSRYPTLEEQRRFIKAYVEHRPQFPHAGSTPNLTPHDTPLGTPGLGATTPGSSSIVDFMLDARIPPGGYKDDEKRREEQVEQRIKELLEETRLWRTANSAQWVAWGIMQAKVPGLEQKDGPPEDAEAKGSQPAAIVSPEEQPGGADEFDYLAYAHERALLFWGDCVKMGVVKMEELPEELRGKIKLIEY